MNCSSGLMVMFSYRHSYWVAIGSVIFVIMKCCQMLDMHIILIISMVYLIEH